MKILLIIDDEGFLYDDRKLKEPGIEPRTLKQWNSYTVALITKPGSDSVSYKK